jgi:nitrite reductase/ring-hydroxylating ferredoxin subunit
VYKIQKSRNPTIAMPAMLLRGLEVMDEQLDRRGFLRLLTRALLWFSGAVGMVGLIRFLSYDHEPASKSLYTLEPPTAYPLDSITPIPEARIFLVRDQAGFYARSLICPHLGCVVEKNEGGYQCPCHGSRFGELGELMNGPASHSLNSVWLGLDEEGRLVVDVRTEVAWEWRFRI